MDQLIDKEFEPEYEQLENNLNQRDQHLVIFWFRRDLRLKDNVALFHALSENENIQPIFIFDQNILSKLKDKNDKRVSFIYKNLVEIKNELQQLGSDLWVKYGDPINVLLDIVSNKKVKAIYTNHDYEPYAMKRDKAVADMLKERNIEFKTYKDHVLFEKTEILNEQGKPYTVFTPYKKKYLIKLNKESLQDYNIDKLLSNLNKPSKNEKIIRLESFGFSAENIEFPPRVIKRKIITNYDKTRDYPSLIDGTSHLGIHLRFGTLSVRELLRITYSMNSTFVSEIIWRDFFQQILWNFPHVVDKSFRREYDSIAWRKSKKDLISWQKGETGYPLVDAGMRELNQTGYMHNRVRMVVASFLCKHLLIHWSEGQNYFAEKLLDFDLAANNGNWQWAAGSGCDAAPYFRIFNPASQMEKFDQKMDYVLKWVPEYGTGKYIKEMISHDFARKRALVEYGKILKKGKS